MHMETTPYFESVARVRHTEALRQDWVEQVISEPEYTDREGQPHGRLAMWGFIEERGYYMRVVVEADERTVHNAFFDRSYTRRVRRSSR